MARVLDLIGNIRSFLLIGLADGDGDLLIKNKEPVLLFAEIAAQEEVPEGTVKSWLSRGRTALAEHLRDDRKGESHV